MFKIFDNIAEVVLVFLRERLIYANNAACFFFGCYEKSLMQKAFEDIFENSSAEALYELASGGTEERAELNIRKGSREIFRVRTVSECDGDFLVLHSKSPLKVSVDEYNFNKIIAPRAIYDPISSGRFHIMNYEISDGYMRLQEELQSLSKIPEASASAREISLLVGSMMNEFSAFADELVSADSKYVMLKKAFSINELLNKITNRMNNVFRLENIDAEVIYENPKGKDAVIYGDYMKIGCSVIALITLIIKLLSKKKRTKKVTLSLSKDENYCYIDISSSSAVINKETYNSIINNVTEVISLNRYKTDKMVLDIHTVSAYVELNEGELSIKRDKKDGTDMMLKFPLVKRKFTLREPVFAESEEYIDKIISKIILFLLGNV